MSELHDPSRLSPGTKTVLIVDDDESILNLLEILVKRDGFKVLTADTVESAVYKLQREPDIIILDLILPGNTSGIDVLKKLGEGGSKTPKVVVLTAAGASHEAAVAAKQDPNVSHFLQKPLKQDQLLELLHSLLGTCMPVHEKPKKAAEG
jgi:two-component system response regulator PilR (NtrC family)